MNAAKTTLTIALAILLPGVVFVTYTKLNADERLFVDRFGCGCHPFFNTNHLSLLISGSTLLVSAFLWWTASRSFPRRWRTGFRIFSSIAALWFLHFFMLHNAWL